MISTRSPRVSTGSPRIQIGSAVLALAGSLSAGSCGSDDARATADPDSARGEEAGSTPPGVFPDGGASDAGPSGKCTDKAPAEAFAPVVQWTWTAPPTAEGSLLRGSTITPLVGNFTDDNGDGVIDRKDVPDVVVTAIHVFDGAMNRANIYLLSGDTGTEKVKLEGLVDGLVSPAFGDLDGDGKPEIVTLNTEGRLVAYSNTGSIAWVGDVSGYGTTMSSRWCTTIGLYDLDGDGSTEILVGWEVFDATGHKRFGDPTNAAEFADKFWCVTPTAADLDGDGKLEVLMGHETFHADGTLYWKIPDLLPAHPHVANLDADPEPEIFLTNADGITVVEHDGTIKFGPVRPTDPTPARQCWGKPAVVHDFDGDGIADIATATCSDYSVYKVGSTGVSPLWTRKVTDFTGLATATAFDFLGDGTAEAIYADENLLYAFDGKTGLSSLTAPRRSATLIEYPVVADIDNDRSAEIVLVSNYTGSDPAGPTVTAIKDANDRWIPARRIWNQYSYHVTNVDEDGRIPKQMKKNWAELNTFRTNSQIGQNGEDCDPAKPVN